MIESLEQLRADLMFLAHRQRKLENAIEEWSEFVSAELLKQGIRISKHQISDRYNKQALNDKFKADYEKFESVFLKIKQLFAREKDERYLYK